MRTHNIHCTFILKKIEKIPLLCLLTWSYDYHSFAQTIQSGQAIEVRPYLLLEYTTSLYYKRLDDVAVTKGLEHVNFIAS